MTYICGQKLIIVFKAPANYQAKNFMTLVKKANCLSKNKACLSGILLAYFRLFHDCLQQPW